MSVGDLSRSTQNYLKAIWSLQEWSEGPVGAGRIAERAGVKTSTVSGAIPKLAEQGLVQHSPYGGVSLTDAGRTHAVAMVRRHRLLETFLVEVLGYTWDEVHDEAENLEYAVSNFLIDRIDEHLGHPDRDPHGDPIPDARGAVPTLPAQPLDESVIGRRVSIERISDADPDLLKFFDSEGIRLGAHVSVEAGPPYSGALRIVPLRSPDRSSEDLSGNRREPTTLGARAAEAIFVTALED